MKRYDFWNSEGAPTAPDPDPHGAFVRFEDHQAELTALQTEFEVIRQERIQADALIGELHDEYARLKRECNIWKTKALEQEQNFCSTAETTEILRLRDELTAANLERDGLRGAIEAHRKDVMDDPIEQIGYHDERLWSVLEEMKP